MTRNEFERIADAVLEGTATPDERERFVAHVAGDPEAGQIWSDLQIAHSTLSKVELEPTPAGLRMEILQSVRSFQRSRNHSWWSEVLATFRARPALAYGMTFAVGLAVGILTLGTFGGGFEAGRELAPSTVATTMPQRHAAVPVAIEVGGATIEVTAGRSRDGSTVMIAGRTGSADVTLEWDPQAHGFAGLQGGASDVLAADNGRVSIRLTPDSQWNLVLRRRAAGNDDLHVIVKVGDREERRTFHLPG